MFVKLISFSGQNTLNELYAMQINGFSRLTDTLQLVRFTPNFAILISPRHTVHIASRISVNHLGHAGQRAVYLETIFGYTQISSDG